MAQMFGIDEDKLDDDAFITTRFGHNDMLWAIHWKYDEDEDGKPRRYLHAGTSQRNDDGTWSRPDDADEAQALDNLFGNPDREAKKAQLVRTLAERGVMSRELADAIASGDIPSPFESHGEIGDDDKPFGPPRNLFTGEVMPEEMQKALAQALRSGEAKVMFAPGVKEQMEKDGLTEDDMMALMRKSVNALDS